MQCFFIKILVTGRQTGENDGLFVSVCKNSSSIAA